VSEEPTFERPQDPDERPCEVGAAPIPGPRRFGKSRRLQPEAWLTNAGLA
jgi:hypothetical protein